MHIESFPPSHNHPDWEHVFVSIDDAEVGAACQAWFEQWCKLDDLQSDPAKHYHDCLPALHALSNRTSADLWVFLERFDDPEDPLHKELGYIWARGVFTAAVAAVGWEGFAMRCATDSKGYAGYMQFIEREGLYGHIDDLVDNPHVGRKLTEALDLYGEHIAYPWIGAACIRWAIFGENTSIEDLPHGVQWLKALYAPRQVVQYWGPREVLSEPVDFGAHADVIKILLQSSDVWTHMLLQEGRFSQSQDHTSIRLWLQWAESVGHECSEAREFFDDGKYLEMTNCILQGDATDLAMMELMDSHSYLMQRALRHHEKTHASLALPDDLASPSP